MQANRQKIIETVKKHLTKDDPSIRNIDVLELEKKKAEVMVQERKDIISMRRNWSWGILTAIISIVLFDFFIITAVGFGWMMFSETYLVPMFIAESLIKIVGLAYIVVNFLFNKDSFV